MELESGLADTGALGPGHSDYDEGRRNQVADPAFKNRAKGSVRKLLLLTIAGCVPHLAAASDSDEDNGLRFWFGAGPVVRGGMRMQVEGSSYAQLLGLHDPRATGPLSPPSGIGTTNAYGDRTYGNGYVNLDVGTGNPASPNPSQTWNWGFTDPKQYNPTARTLTFQKTGTPGYTAASTPANGSEDFLGPGVQVELGARITHTEDWSLDLVLGFQGIFNDREDLSLSSYREQVRQIRVTDVYDVSGIAPANFPANGFHGTFLGPFDSPPVIPSPQIPNIPQSRASAVSAPLSTSFNQIDFELSQQLYQFSLGPHLTVLEDRGVKIYLRPTISANLINASVQRSEVFAQKSASGGSVVLERWSDQASHLGISVGLGGLGGFDLDLGHGFFTSAFGGYEWVADKVKVPVGPNTLSVDATGWVVGGLLGLRF